MTVQALREVRTKLHLGMTELEGERLITDALTGAGLTSLSAIVLFGANAALPHASASAAKRLEAGEFALFDVGGHLLGYDSDFTRTMLPDPQPNAERAWPSARAELVWKTVRAAQVAALEAEVNANAPGGVVSAASVDKAARDSITAAGFGPYFTHRLGHGIGLLTHEVPYLNSGNVGQPLNSGVTHSNEPGGVPQTSCVAISHVSHNLQNQPTQSSGTPSATAACAPVRARQRPPPRSSPPTPQASSPTRASEPPPGSTPPRTAPP